MASSQSVVGTRPVAAAPRTRAAPRTTAASPVQRPLLLAAVLVLLGSFLPWIETAVGTYGGMAGAGVWTFYAGALAVGAALVRHRGVARAQAAVAGTVAAGLPAWQLVHLLDRAGLGGWAPGMGLILVLGGGVIALGTAWRMHP